MMRQLTFHESMIEQWGSRAGLDMLWGLMRMRSH